MAGGTVPVSRDCAYVPVVLVFPFVLLAAFLVSMSFALDDRARADVAAVVCATLWLDVLILALYGMHVCGCMCFGRDAYRKTKKMDEKMRKKNRKQQHDEELVAVDVDSTELR